MGLRLVAAVGLSVCLAVVLFGTYQYQAHDRRWGMSLILWTCVALLAVGGAGRYQARVGWLELLAAGLVVTAGLGWHVTWHWRSRWRHAWRGLVTGLFVGPGLALWTWAAQDRYLGDLPEVYRLAGVVDAAREHWPETWQRQLVAEAPVVLALAALAGTVLSLGLAYHAHRSGWSRSARGTLAALALGTIGLAHWYGTGLVLRSGEAACWASPALLRYLVTTRPGAIGVRFRAHCGSLWGKCKASNLLVETLETNAAAVQVLLDRGIDVNAPVDGDVKTSYLPLHVAAAHGDAAILRVLLDADADPHARTSGGNTSLHVAVTPEAVDLLLAHGAEIEARNSAGLTPLACATEGRVVLEIPQLPVMAALLRAGANPNATGLDGRQPLIFDCVLHHRRPLRLTMARMLLAAGADPNGTVPRDSSEKTPLMQAAEHRDIEMVRILLATGVQVNRARHGYTALDLAQEDGQEEIVKLLKAAGGMTGDELYERQKQADPLE